jgi:hypothetical protein
MINTNISIITKLVKLMKNITLSRFWWVNLWKSEQTGLRPAQTASYAMGSLHRRKAASNPAQLLKPRVA